MKYIIYARKSSEDRSKQIQSIDDQVKALKEFAKSRSLTIVDVLTEEKTAKEPGVRPVFTSMLERILAGEAQGILVWKEDRIARNLQEGGLVIHLLQKAVIQEIRTPDAVHVPTDSLYMLTLALCGAAQYSIDLSKNVKRGLKSKLDKGWMPGSAPLGYLNTKTEARGDNYIIKDPDRFPLLRKAWDLMLTGNYTADEVRNKLNNEWGFRTRKGKKKGSKPISRSTIYRILTNRFYVGQITYQLGGRKSLKRGEKPLLIPGNHDPMVTKEEFDHVQLLLGRNGKPRPNRYEYAYTGMIRCGECGGLISATFKEKILKTKNERATYTLYYCIKARKNPDVCMQGLYTNAHTLESQIVEQLEKLSIAPEFVDWALAILAEQSEQEIDAEAKLQATHAQAVESAKKQLENLTRLRIQEILDDEEYAREKTRLKNELTDLELKRAQTGMPTKTWRELTQQAFIFARDAKDAFLSGDAEVKKSVISGIGLNWRLKDHALNFDLVEWLIPLSENKVAFTKTSPTFEPTINGSTKRQKEAFTSCCPELRE